MPKLYHEITMSLDGFVAGPNTSLEQPLGEGGERLHEWATGLESWRESHGKSGGRSGRDDELMQESIDRGGAVIMGKNMFGPGPGPWGDDPWQGWWGEDPPFHKSVFVLTHHEREPLRLSDTTFTFVTDGPESALEQARDAAGDKDVQISGGASVAAAVPAGGPRGRAPHPRRAGTARGRRAPVRQPGRGGPEARADRGRRVAGGHAPSLPGLIDAPSR